MGDEWPTVKLGNACSKIGSGATPRGGSKVYLTQGDIALIRSQNVYNSGFSQDGLVYISNEDAKKLENVTVKRDDILLNITGDSVARCCQVKSEVLPARVNQHVAIIRPDPKILDPVFLKYFLISPKQQSLMLSLSHAGATRKALTKGMIESFIIPRPESNEQRAIAHILGTLDDKIELNRQMNRTLEAMAQALFKSWFIDFDPVVVNALRAGNPVPEKFAQRAAHYRDNPDALRLPEDTLRQFPDRFQDSELGPIPEGWNVQSLDDIATFLNGLACQKYPAAPGEPSLPVIKIRELRQGISGNTDRATTNVPEKYIVHDGDVLFSWSGSLLIDIWTQGKGVLNQHVFKVSSENYPKWFYFHWVDFHLLEFQRIAADKATTMGHIKRHHLADAKVVVPDSDIMKLASVHVSPIFDNKIENAIQARSLAKLRDTLLPKLISGELRVPDAEKFLEDVL